MASYLENFVKNAIWSNTAGLLGLENPNEEVQEWAAENPKMALATDIAGLLAGGAGALKLTKATKYGKWAQGLGAAEKFAASPFKATALKEMALWAPFELGRQGAGYAIQLADGEDTYGEADLGERVLQAGVDLGTAGLISGGLGLISAAGKKAKVPEVLASLDPGDPWQYQLRQVKEGLGRLDPNDLETAGTLQQSIYALENKILNEEAGRMVGDLELGMGGKIGGLFKGTAGAPARKFIVESEKGFQSLAAKDSVLAGLDLPQGWIEEVQYPRWISPKGAKSGAQVTRRIQENLQPVGQGWRIGKEEEGLWVIAKEAGPGKWFLAKTDNPGFFVGEQAGLAKVLDKKAWLDPDSIVKGTGDAGAILDKALVFNDLMEPGAQGLKRSSRSVAGITDQWLKKAGLEGGLDTVAGGDNLLAENVKNAFNRYIKPTVFQFKNSPLARKIYALQQFNIDNGKKRAAEWLFGKVSTEGKNVWEITRKGIKRADPGAFATRLRELAEKNPTGFDQLVGIIDKQIPFEVVLKSPEILRNLGSDGVEVLTKLDQIDKGVYKEIFDSAVGLGIPDAKLFPMKKGHYGFSHYWKGSIRQGITDENGALVHIVSGNNKKGVTKLAEGVINEAAAEGKKWRLGNWWTLNRDLDLAQEKLLSASDFELGEQLAKRYALKHPEVQKASFFMPQAGVGGYNRGKTAEELIENLRYSVDNKYTWLARQINERVSAKDLATLAIDDPQTAIQLDDKLKALRGEEGLLGQAVNKFADQILAPVLGTGSASKIVRTLNTASVYLDLGFANLAYVTANMLQPITTVLPQLSLLKNCPEALAWAYDTVPLVSASGRGGQASTMNPLKVMYEGWKLMAHPERRAGFKEFLDQAIADGALSPRFIESYIGENSQISQGLADSLKKGNFSGMLKEAATGLPSFSEQASRGYALTVGYAYFDSIAKATGQLTKEQVYSGARRFMENTMFQFAASDRAKILQGPVGQAWGLFKNWTMHFVGWQLEYLNAGLKYNCWAPYMWSNVATSVLGGLSASELGAVAQGFAEWGSEQKLQELLYENWGDGLGSSSLLYGVPGAFGISLKSQINSPFRDPGEETMRFMGMVWGNRLASLWKAAGAGFDYWSTSGENPAQSEAFQLQLSRALAPKMIYRSMQVVGDSLYGLNRNKIIEGLSPMEALAYQYFNLPSIRIEQGFEISNEIWKNKEKQSALTAKYGEAMADALDAQDGRLIQKIVSRAIADGVDVQNMMKSANKRLEGRMLTPLERNTQYYPELGGILWD